MTSGDRARRDGGGEVRRSPSPALTRGADKSHGWEGHPTRSRDGQMITVTRLNGPAFALNPDLIERIEATPDTVITLVGGTNYVVVESVDELVARVRESKAAIIALVPPHRPTSAAARPARRTGRRAGGIEMAKKKAAGESEGPRARRRRAKKKLIIKIVVLVLIAGFVAKTTVLKPPPPDRGAGRGRGQARRRRRSRTCARRTTGSRRSRSRATRRRRAEGAGHDHDHDHHDADLTGRRGPGRLARLDDDEPRRPALPEGRVSLQLPAGSVPTTVKTTENWEARGRSSSSSTRSVVRPSTTLERRTRQSEENEIGNEVCQKTEGKV